MIQKFSEKNFLEELEGLKHILEDEHYSFVLEDNGSNKFWSQYNLMINEYPYGPADNISALDMSELMEKDFMNEFIDRLEETSIKFGFKFKHMIMRSGDNLPTGCFILTKIN